VDATAVFTALGRELWLITARAGEHRGGLIATFVSQASIVPEMPRMVVGLARHHHTWELIEASGAFALHLIGEQHLDWVWRFGLQSGRQVDKLAGLAIRAAATGSPILTDALAWLDCRVEAPLDTGDRTLYLAEVVDSQRLRTDPPLTVQRMLQLAPLEKMRELKQQMDQDIAIDAEAIRRWRQQKKDVPSPQ
jgi:flavin reductase (DIM6/NTAB) family NADH-FMN oxidoreductase RutF